MRLLCLLLLTWARAVVAQQPLETKLAIQQGGREVGREEFSLRQGRGGGSPGTTLIAAARYPANNPATKMAATLERAPDLSLTKFQLDVDGPNGTTVILAAGSGARLIIRTVAKGSEAGRELPGGPDIVLLDDQLFSLYCAVTDLATPAGRSLTAIFPRSNRRASFVARREAGGENGNTRVTLTGNITGTLTTDAEGRLFRLELPESGTVVTRASD